MKFLANCFEDAAPQLIQEMEKIYPHHRIIVGTPQHHSYERSPNTIVGIYAASIPKIERFQKSGDHK